MGYRTNSNAIAIRYKCLIGIYHFTTVQYDKGLILEESWQGDSIDNHDIWLNMFNTSFSIIKEYFVPVPQRPTKYQLRNADYYISIVAASIVKFILLL